jgi:hypothetical protein
MALAIAAVVALVMYGENARGDVAPPDSCSGAGPCNNAGPNYNQPGDCVQSSCNHPLPDGGTSSYTCFLCELSDSGGGSSSGSSGSGSSSGAAIDGGSSSGGGGGSSKSGCATSPLARDGATGLAMLAVGVAALAWARRRRP